MTAGRINLIWNETMDTVAKLWHENCLIVENEGMDGTPRWKVCITLTDGKYNGQAGFLP